MDLKTGLEFTLNAYQEQVKALENFANSTTNPEERNKTQLVADLYHGFIHDMQHLLDTTEGREYEDR